jgi:hypothetical protein
MSWPSYGKELGLISRSSPTYSSVIRSIPLLDQAAIDAVKQWEYEPFLVNGEPMAFILTVTVSFKLT